MAQLFLFVVGNVNWGWQENGDKFIEEISKQKDIYKMKSGILIQIISNAQNPEAKSPRMSDSVILEWDGFLYNKTKFDGGRVGVPLTNDYVVPGWKEALQLMSEGDRWKIFVPQYLAHGAEGKNEHFFHTPVPPFTPIVIEAWLDKVDGLDREKLKSAAEARALFLDSLAEDSPLKSFPSTEGGEL